MFIIRLILIITFFCIINLTLKAQKIEIGAKGGLNFTEYNTDLSEVYSRYHIGGFARFYPNKKLGIQTEVVYSIEGTNKSEYLLIPVLAKYYFNRYFHIHAGPQLYIPLSEVIPVSETDIYSPTKKLSIVSGIGVDLFTGVGIALRYARSVVPDNIQKRDQHVLQVSLSLELN